MLIVDLCADKFLQEVSDIGGDYVMFGYNWPENMRKYLEKVTQARLTVPTHT